MAGIGATSSLARVSAKVGNSHKPATRASGRIARTPCSVP
jgi:hypothetical protein